MGIVTNYGELHDKCGKDWNYVCDVMGWDKELFKDWNGGKMFRG